MKLSFRAPFIILIASLLSACGGGGDGGETTTVPASPKASYSVAVTDLMASFTNASTGGDGALTYAWNFGDSNISTDTSPIHTYTTAGSYTVSLTITDATGNTSKASKSVAVTAPPVPPPPPQASFNVAVTDLMANFTNASTGGDGVLSYVWNFGDSITSTDTSPVHTYSTAGSYTVSLTITDTIGNKSTVHQSVVVTAAPTPIPDPEPTPDPEPPLPLEVSYTVAVTNLMATFTNTSTGGEGALTYAWNFGDSNSSTDTSPVHAYTTAGSYPVSLTITDSMGTTSTVNKSVTVTAPPISPEASYSVVVTNLMASFTNTSTGGEGALTYAWNFGDSNSSTDTSPVHAYSAAGDYTVSLTITDTAGKTNSTSLPVTATAPPLPPEASYTVAVKNLTASFTNTSTGGDGVLTYAWDFGDSINSAETSPVHTYSAAGDYTVSLTITDTAGKTNSTTLPVTVTALPVVSVTTVNTLAIEKSNQFANFVIERSGDTTALSLQFTTSGNTNITKGSASPEDYRLVYSDGGDVGNTLELAANQNSRVIEVQPVLDNLHEVPETLTLTITNSSNYTLSSNNSSAVVIVDANNDSENNKLFLGSFTPQNNAITNGSGELSLILSGDNESARLSYHFSNLGSAQTDQHIHLAPSGTMIKDIEHMGPLTNYLWDLAPGGPFVTEQDMLDTLFNGEFFVNIHSANYSAGEISARIIYEADIEAPEETPLSAEDVDRDIIRFLTQATFGATPEDYQVLREQINENGDNRLLVYNDWIEEQFTREATSLLALTDASVALFAGDKTYNSRRDAFWPIALYGKDQLRQRMTFALSEILVIGDQVQTIYQAYRGVAGYWDQLAGNAFTTYRATLGDASLHPTMGAWLSHLRNQKADAEQGFYPDENYAREIMQLFSFGLVHKQENGSTKLGDNNLPMATYDNEVIKAMARVFTGLGFSHRSNGDGDKYANTNFSLNNNPTVKNQYRWVEQMKFFPDYHDFGEKILFTIGGAPVIIEANSDHSAETAQAELDTVLDALVSHESTAPVISRKLIQRFVSSNPSAEYIERVAITFGQTGDLKAVIKAILLDKEARNPLVENSPFFGKLKEPVLQLTALMRLLQANSEIPLGSGENNDALALNLPFADQYQEGATLMRLGEMDIGQRALGSPSVFNFFLPDFAPTGQLASHSLVSPELQLYTESQLFNTFNAYEAFISNGAFRNKAKINSSYSESELTVALNKNILPAIWDQTAGDNLAKAEAVVDYLDFYLSAGQLKQTNNSNTRQIFIDSIATAEATERFDLAIFSASISPEFLIQK